MAELDLVELRGLLERATPRPWEHRKHGARQRITGDQGLTVAHCPVGHMTKHHEDAALIVAVVNVLPALLSRLEQHSPVSDGWRLVPVEPTDDMVAAGWLGRPGRASDWVDGYRAMLSASPPPPGGRGRDEDGAESILSDAPSPCTSADVVGTADVGSLPMPWRRFVVSAWEFLSDWHKGDFGLDGLAKHDAQSMSDAWPGPTQEDCPMCLGRGEVGGFVRWGEAGSWESEPCPQCQPPSAAGQSLNGLAQDGSTLVPLTAEMARAQADLHAEQAAAIADLTGKLAKAAEGMRAACDLLAERTYDNPARSPGHNARLTLEGVLREIEHAG